MPLLQVVAYNKVDVPDSGDYIDFVREELMADGIPAGNIFAVSAATGQGVLDLVRRVRQVVDDLGPLEQVYETNAVNQKKLPRRENQRMDDFTIEIEEPHGPDKPRVYYVNGKALEKFAQVSFVCPGLPVVTFNPLTLILTLTYTLTPLTPNPTLTPTHLSHSHPHSHSHSYSY